MSPDDAYVAEWNYEMSRLSIAPTSSDKT